MIVVFKYFLSFQIKSYYIVKCHKVIQIIKFAKKYNFIFKTIINFTSNYNLALN